MELADELVIDLSCVCDTRTGKAFEIADSILLVTGQTTTSETKINQFLSQNNVYENIKDKITLIANKGATVNSVFHGTPVSFPYIQSSDTKTICNTLSDFSEQWSQIRGRLYDGAS